MATSLQPPLHLALPAFLALSLGLAAAGPAALPSAGQEAASGARAAGDLAVRELHLASPEGTRVEHFVLQDEEARPVGLARLLSGPDAETLGSGGEGLLLEAEFHFFAEDTRVLHAERLRSADADGIPWQKLVWREMRPRSGRTILAEGALGSSLKSSDTSGADVVRRVHDGPRGALLPLALLEAAREGETPTGTYSVFQPLSCALEDLSVELFVDRSRPAAPAGDAEDAGEERVLRFLRADGSSAGRFVFQGDRLVRFRLQAGGPEARAVSRADYDRLRAGRVQRGAAPLEAPAGAPPRGGIEAPPATGSPGHRESAGPR